MDDVELSSFVKTSRSAGGNRILTFDFFPTGGLGILDLRMALKNSSNELKKIGRRKSR